MVSVEDSRERGPRVASKTEQKDAPKADAVAEVSADSAGPTSADSAALTSVKPAQFSVLRWVYSAELPSR